MKKLIVAAVLAAGFAAVSAAQTPEEVARQTSTPGFSDPSFQDFVETTYGYMSPGNRPAAFRDAVASSSAAAVPAPAAYVFVSILPRDADYSALLRELSSSAGFVLKGERTSRSGGVRRLRIVGWARADAVSAMRANPGVAGLSVGKKKTRAGAAI